MNNDLNVSADRVENAKCPEDVFGNLTGTQAEKEAQLVALYKKLVIVLHPDRYADPADQAKAKDAFVKVTVAKADAEKKLKAGTYGDRKNAAAPPPVTLDPIVIDTRRYKYKVEGLLGASEIADVYHCVEQKSGDRVLLKVARSARDNDLMVAESTHLRKLYPEKAKNIDYYRYLMKLQDSFLLRGSKGSKRRVNVFPVAGGYVSLVEVMAAWEDGLDYRDMAWMFRRMLEGLGFVHREGFVHGCLNPSTVLVHPKKHGAKIIDWCYSVDLSNKLDRVRAMSTKYSDYCAPEIKSKLRPGPESDIYSAAACAVALIGGNPETGAMPETVPREVQNFLKACMLIAPSRRPDDAWDLYDDFGRLMRKLVGKPAYRPLAMPSVSPS